MAKNSIAMGINVRKNKNSKSLAFGKYYPEVDTKPTLTLKGFAQHLVDHGSIYGVDIVEGVLKKITQCLPELLSQGVPVQLEPLGTFYPSAKVKDPLTSLADFEGADPMLSASGLLELPVKTLISLPCEIIRNAPYFLFSYQRRH